MTENEVVLMGEAVLGEWEAACQYPYDCYPECPCQRMRRSDGAKQNVTVEEKGDVK